MGDERVRSYLVGKRIDAWYVLAMVAEVWSQLTEKLRHTCRIRWELHTLIPIRIDAHTPDVEPEHLVCQWLHFRSCRSTASPATAGQVHYITAPTMAKHQGRETIPAIGRHLPTHPRTAITMHINKRCLVGIGRNLIIHKSMVHTTALSCFHLCCPTNELAVVVSTFVLNNRSTDREMALFLDDQVLG